MTNEFKSTPYNKWNHATPCTDNRNRSKTFIDYDLHLKECNGCHEILDWEGNFRPTERGYPAARCIPCANTLARERNQKTFGYKPAKK